MVEICWSKPYYVVDNYDLMHACKQQHMFLHSWDDSIIKKLWIIRVKVHVYIFGMLSAE